MVVVVGGGLVGLELAEFLAERGRRVTVVEEGDKLGGKITVLRFENEAESLLHYLKDIGVKRSFRGTGFTLTGCFEDNFKQEQRRQMRLNHKGGRQ